MIAATVHLGAQQKGRTSTAPPGLTGGRAPQTPKILPGTRPDVFSVIQGNALTAANTALSDTAVRLRDARSGQIVNTVSTDKSGLFAFHDVDPGSYVVEIIGEDHASVLAASQLLNVGAAEAVSVIVKLPFKVPPLAKVFGGSTSSAVAVAAQAASAGILATQVSGAETCATLQP
jgi:hypothetical protein